MASYKNSLSSQTYPKDHQLTVPEYKHKRGIATGPGFSDYFSSDFPSAKRGLLFGPGFFDFVNEDFGGNSASDSLDSKRGYGHLEEDPKRGIEDLISGIAPTSLGGNEDVKPRIRVYRRDELTQD